MQYLKKMVRKYVQIMSYNFITEFLESPNPERFKRSRRQSVICFGNDQQQWVFEEQEPQDSIDKHAAPSTPTEDKIKLENTMNYGRVQVIVNMLYE